MVFLVSLLWKPLSSGFWHWHVSEIALINELSNHLTCHFVFCGMKHYVNSPFPSQPCLLRFWGSTLSNLAAWIAAWLPLPLTILPGEVHLSPHLPIIWPFDNFNHRSPFPSLTSLLSSRPKLFISSYKSTGHTYIEVILISLPHYPCLLELTSALRSPSLKGYSYSRPAFFLPLWNWSPSL